MSRVVVVRCRQPTS